MSSLRPSGIKFKHWKIEDNFEIWFRWRLGVKWYRLGRFIKESSQFTNGVSKHICDAKSFGQVHNKCCFPRQGLPEFSPNIDKSVLICSQPMRDKPYSYFEENVSLSLIGLKDYKYWESFFLEDEVEIGYFGESPGVLAINARQENIWLKTQPAYQVVHKASLQVSQVITSDKFGQANRFKLTIFNTEFVPEYFYTKRNPSCTGKRFSICMHICILYICTYKYTHINANSYYSYVHLCVLSLIWIQNTFQSYLNSQSVLHFNWFNYEVMLGE